jgi:transcriptional regulator with XRE-family HTH domain
VIDMALLSVIRRWHFREGMPIREIERRTGLSRNTIRKYLRSDNVEPKSKVSARPCKLDRFAQKLSDTKGRPASALRDLLKNKAAGGIFLVIAAAIAMILANSPAAPLYFDLLKAHVGSLSVLHWINDDALMAVFFLLVGLEIKRELLDGQLSTWPRRILPGDAAGGGMIDPALLFVAFNSGSPDSRRTVN